MPSFINSATISYEFTKEHDRYAETFKKRSAEFCAEIIEIFDLGMTYAASNFQLEAGVKIGVTDAADDLIPYAGVSQRFKWLLELMRCFMRS